ncbi:MAG: glycosyltransferase [Gammaproteobacteria bacterium]|nr:glycosyltransferase [Gammaproteobacteria bacterium]
MKKARFKDDVPVISVIVPMYKVANYVQECLDSIADQDFEETCEIIVVNDCSPDDSGKICRNWISTHSTTVKYIENERNMGVSSSRNRGLEAAEGEYFMFVDPDDVLPRHAMSALYQAAESFNVDIVKGNNTIFTRTSETEARYNVGSSKLVENDAILTTLYEHDRVRGHPWGKLFRREQLGCFRFPVGVRMAQDLFYCSEVFANARSLLLLDKNVYRYRKHDSGSTGRKFESGSYIDWLEAVEATAQFARNRSHLRAHKNLLVRTMTQLAREARKLPSDQAQEVLSDFEQRCRKWRIQLPGLILRDKLGLKSLSRYIKMRLAIRQIRSSLKCS